MNRLIKLVRCVTKAFLLKPTLCALCQCLSLQETLREAPLESVLLSISYVLVLQQAV